MKTVNIIAIAILAGLAIGATPKHKRDVIILRGEQRSISWSNGQGYCGNGWAYTGIRVLNASSSDPAHTYQLPIYWTSQVCSTNDIVPDIGLADAIADALEAGYEIKCADAVGLNFVLVR